MATLEIFEELSVLTRVGIQAEKMGWDAIIITLHKEIRGKLNYVLNKLTPRNNFGRFRFAYDNVNERNN